MSEYNRCFVTVDLDAIGHNIAQVRKIIEKNSSKHVKVMAVVKANAYGHGAIKVSSYLEDKVEYFGVATLEEAIELRDAGIKLPILILGYTSPSQYEEAILHDITVTIYDLGEGIKLDDTARKVGKNCRFHVALDTGMTRIGFPLNNEGNLNSSIDNVLKLSKLECANLEGAFTHFACADMADKTYFYMQKDRLVRFFDECDKRNIDIEIKHCANSASIIEFDDMTFDMVRSGIITYGLEPSEEVDLSEFELRPAMQFKTHVVRVRDVEPGEGISYGATYTTKDVTRVATLSVGYADGYKRCLSGVGRVLINGEYAPILGRVCMDQMMVDVTNIPDVKVEDEVVLFGKSANKILSVEEIADMSHSFNYEFVCSVSARVVRVYE